jgi:predicted DNA-binding mobile mystery protein A
MRAVASRRGRRRLDTRLGALRPEQIAVPPAGWVRAVRDALGMSQADLAARLDVTPQAIQQVETSERDGRVRLATLRRAAEAMDCTLVYALVPNTSLEDTVIRQARAVVGAEVEAAERTMALEAQDATLPPEAVRELTDRLLDSKALWSRR